MTKTKNKTNLLPWGFCGVSLHESQTEAMSYQEKSLELVFWFLCIKISGDQRAIVTGEGMPVGEGQSRMAAATWISSSPSWFLTQLSSLLRSSFQKAFPAISHSILKVHLGKFQLRCLALHCQKQKHILLSSQLTCASYKERAGIIIEKRQKNHFSFH